MSEAQAAVQEFSQSTGTNQADRRMPPRLVEGVLTARERLIMEQTACALLSSRRLSDDALARDAQRAAQYLQDKSLEEEIHSRYELFQSDVRDVKYGGVADPKESASEFRELASSALNRLREQLPGITKRKSVTDVMRSRRSDDLTRVLSHRYIAAAWEYSLLQSYFSDPESSLDEDTRNSIKALLNQREDIF